MNSKHCIHRKTKLWNRWKTIAEKLFNSMKQMSFCCFSLFLISQQLGRPICTQSIFSTQSIVHFHLKGQLHLFVARSIVTCSSITQLLTVNRECNMVNHWVHLLIYWPSGLLLTKLKANYQTFCKIAGSSMPELLQDPKSNLLRR